MKRDDEYIRNLLLEIENQDIPFISVFEGCSPSKEERKKNYHIKLLCDAGLMTFQGGSAYRLTNQGHDYVEVIKNDNIWKRTKEGAAQIGGATLDMLKNIAIAYLKQEAAEKLGIKL